MGIVEDHDLSATPMVVPFDLSQRFVFKPGVYTVRFSTDIGIDDDSNPRPTFNPREPTGLYVNKFFKHHSVRVNSEIELHIAGAPLK